MEPLSLDKASNAGVGMVEATPTGPKMPHFANTREDVTVESVVEVTPVASPRLAADLEEMDEEQRERARVLRELDERPFGWFHVKAVLVSGIGFFTDAYDLFVINLVVPMIGYCYWASNGNKVPTTDAIFMKGSATIGTFIGQLCFGFLGDFLGRKKIYGVELLIMIFSTICTAMACTTHAGVSVTWMLSLWRLVLGFGIGGDYPLSAVLTSEYASKKRRGFMIALVFSMQGIGILFAALTAVVLMQCFKSLIEEDQKYVDHLWRLMLLVGVIPAAIAMYFRTRVPESPRYTMEVERNAARAAKDLIKTKSKAEQIDLELAVAAAAKEVEMEQKKKASASPSSPMADGEAMIAAMSIKKADVVAVPKKESVAPKSKGLTWREFSLHFSQWQHLKVLLGASLSWFLLDVAWYGLGLNQSIVLKAIGFSSAKNADAFKALWALASGNALISLMGTVPGYFVTVALVERWGRKPIQLLGFCMLTAIFVILCAAYNPLLNNHKWLFVVLYCLGQFFFNFGPNTTTFIIPGEVFPTRMRSTAHGICAASGKLGAIIAAYGFQPIVDNEKAGGYNGVQVILGIFSGVMFLGILSTLMIPETKGKSLEDLSSGKKSNDSSEMRHLKLSPSTSPAMSPAMSPAVSPQSSPHGSPRLSAMIIPQAGASVATKRGGM